MLLARPVPQDQRRGRPELQIVVSSFWLPQLQLQGIPGVSSKTMSCDRGSTQQTFQNNSCTTKAVEQLRKHSSFETRVWC